MWDKEPENEVTPSNTGLQIHRVIPERLDQEPPETAISLAHTYPLKSHTAISYRIWILVNQGVLKFRGLPGALHQFSVKLGSVD